MLPLAMSANWIYNSRVGVVEPNISNFGGEILTTHDHGQSVVEPKSLATDAMPASKVLVHKGVALSGSMLGRQRTKLQSEAGNIVLEEARINSGQLWINSKYLAGGVYRCLKNALARRKGKSTTGFRGGFGPVA